MAVGRVGLGTEGVHPVLDITRTRYGGHCGFYDGVAGPTWVEWEILTSFDSG